MSSFNVVIKYVEVFNSGDVEYKVAGVVLNVLLLFLIQRFSGPLLGAYRHLLTIFAALDIYLAVIHYVVSPRVLRVDNIHSVVSDTVLDDKRITAFWIGCQSTPFTLLAIHFLYRYWSVRRPHLVSLFSNTIFIVSLAAVILGGLISWYVLCNLTTSGHDNRVALATVVAEYERKYGKRIENAWILMDHWRDSRVDALLISITLLMNAIMLSSVAASSSLAVLTFQYIIKSYKMSAQTSALQRKLLVTLIAQSAIPMIFVYLPYLICINNAFLKIPGTIFHDFCSTAFTFFPVWDPVIIIILFSDYRRGLIGIISKPANVAPTTMYITNSTVNFSVNAS